MNKPIETNSVQSTFDRGIDSATGTVHKAIDSASDAVGPAIKKATDTAHHTVDSMAKGAHHAAETVSTKSTQLHHLQQQLAENTRNQVRNHPLLSLGVALAGGALLAMWLNRNVGGNNAS